MAVEFSVSRSSPNADAMLLGLVTHSFAICEEGMRDELRRSWGRNASRAPHAFLRKECVTSSKSVYVGR